MQDSAAIACVFGMSVERGKQLISRRPELGRVGYPRMMKREESRASIYVDRASVSSAYNGMQITDHNHRLPLPPIMPMPRINNNTTTVEARLIPKSNHAVPLMLSFNASSQCCEL